MRGSEALAVRSKSSCAKRRSVHANCANSGPRRAPGSATIFGSRALASVAIGAGGTPENHFDLTIQVSESRLKIENCSLAQLSLRREWALPKRSGRGRCNLGRTAFLKISRIGKAWFRRRLARRPHQTWAERREYYRSITNRRDTRIAVRPREITVVGDDAFAWGSIYLTSGETSSSPPTAVHGSLAEISTRTAFHRRH